MDRQTLLRKFLNGSCRQEELQQLFHHLRDDPQRNYDPVLREVWESVQVELAAGSRKDAQERENRIVKGTMRRIRGKSLPMPRRFAVRYAAAVALLLLGGVVTIVWLGADEQQDHYTGYGETKTVVLPDGSVALLNANSHLSFVSNWQQRERAVTLTGEAFFRVEKQAATDSTLRKFTVQTDNLTVEVVGTQFNVNHRRGATQVVLNSGRVRVANQQQQLTLHPGELVLASAKEEKLHKRKINTAVYTAWKDNRLVFDHTPLGEIARLLEDNYNYQVSLSDTLVANKTFVGTFPADDIEVLLQTLAKSVDLQQRGQELRIQAAER